MKTIVMWLFGVPIAVSLLFVIFAIDTGKLSLRVEAPELIGQIVAVPEETTSVAAPPQSSRR